MSDSPRFSAPPPEPQPGAGAAFWAARGVRIEPEPDDEDAPAAGAPAGGQDEYAEYGDPAAAWPDPAWSDQDGGEDGAPAEPAAPAHAEEPEPAAPRAFIPAQQRPDGYGAPAYAPAYTAGTAPGDADEDDEDEDEDEDDSDDDASDDYSPDAYSSDASDRYAPHGYATDGYRVDPGDAYDPQPRRDAARQIDLDDVEPQAGRPVDGLAVLGATLAEGRRARQEAAEPAWQLAEGSDSALPPLRACLEAILMVVDEPVTAVVLAQVVERPKSEVVETLRALAQEYTAAGRGFELREVGVGVGDAGQTGWRIYSRAECAPIVERFVRDGQQAKLTQAALETLAVVAYRQPVSRSKVSSIRGVNCDGVMRTLLARGLVEESGTEHETGALLYRTTGYFLERMGLRSLLELPDLAPLLPSAADLEDEQL